jgi:pilus assembly protein CpaB
VKTRLLTVTLAAVLAVVGVVAVAAYVRQANVRAVNGLKAETVYMAAGPIPAGTSLLKAQQAKLLGTEEVPASSVSNAVQKVNGADENEVVTGNVAKGQVLLQNMLGSASSVTPSGGFVLPANDIAVSVPLCEPEDVADYVTPGSYVAVFETLINVSSLSGLTPSCSSGHPALPGSILKSSSEVSTEVVLGRVEVLAVGQNPGPQSTSGSSSGTATSSSSGDVLVTFAVNQTQAEQLIDMQEVGIPYLALLGSNVNSLGGLAAGILGN